MEEYINKWNKYEINKVKWINSRKEHPCRDAFVDFIKNSSFRNILEIGGGELVEAQSILLENPEINYSVVDISDVFLDFAKSIKGISSYKGNMIDIPFKDKQFDIVYCSSVLEHTPDIKKTIFEIQRVSKNFYFNMFKWKNKTGDLSSLYKTKKKYYSSLFNIDMLLQLISTYGNIESTEINYLDGGNDTFNDYREKNLSLDINRNSNYLLIRGVWNK